MLFPSFAKALVAACVITSATAGLVGSRDLDYQSLREARRAKTLAARQNRNGGNGNNNVSNKHKTASNVACTPATASSSIVASLVSSFTAVPLASSSTLTTLTSSSTAASLTSSFTAASLAPSIPSSVAANNKKGNGNFRGNGNGNNNGGNNNNGNTQSSSSSSAAASSTSSAAAATDSASATSNNKASKSAKSSSAAASATAASSSGNSGSSGSTCLESDAIATGSASTGQANGVAADGQVNSATDTANFINFCSGKTLTNGLQVKSGSCNGIAMGEIPSTSNMISSVLINPAPGDKLSANTDFNITVQTQGLAAGSFTNATSTYYSAPQALKNGQVVGHTHVTVQDMGNSLSPSSPPDPTTFAFFKGINDAGNGKGLLSAAVTGGLPKGNYRVCTMTSAANHQPVLMPVAQRGSQDDCTKFTVA